MTGRVGANNRKSLFKNFGISLGLFAYYAGELSIVLWFISALILGVFVRRLPMWFLACAILLIFFLGMRIFLEESSAIDILIEARFYWGFIIFLPFFISEQKRLGSNDAQYRTLFHNLFNLSLILLLIEFLTSNSLSLEWPNRSHELGLELENGSFARAYGFGGNASVTSTLLIALGAILYSGKIVRDIATLGLATSGTGFLVFLLKLAFNLKARHLLMAAVLLIVFFITVFEGLLENGLRDSYSSLAKFSWEYYDFLLDFKYEQFQSVMVKSNEFQLFFGQAFIDPSLRMGDFQLLDFLTFNGMFGIGMMALIVAKCMNTTNRVPLFLLLVATAHYQVIFSIPGQILFAWLLTVGMSTTRQHFKSNKTVTANNIAVPHAIRE